MKKTMRLEAAAPNRRMTLGELRQFVQMAEGEAPDITKIRVRTTWKGEVQWIEIEYPAPPPDPPRPRLKIEDEGGGAL